MPSSLKRLLWISLLVASGTASSAGQAPAQPEAAVNLTPGAPSASAELVATLARKDRELFDAAFGCKPDVLKALVADDFEFFHDKHGQNFNSGAQFVAGIAAGCERQKAGTDFRARRELVDGSMTVHVLKGYGAMQMGVHRFYAVHAGKPDQLTETGKFIHLWKLDQGEWKLARVISYDHVLADKPK